MEEVDGHGLEWLLAKPSEIGLCYQTQGDSLIDTISSTLLYYTSIPI